MRSPRLLAVALLGFVLVLSSAPSALAPNDLAEIAVVELRYDDFTGGVYAISPRTYDAVRFTLSDFGLTSACLLAARLSLSASDDTALTPLRVHVLGADGKTSLVTPFDFTGPSNDNWNDAYLPGGGVTVTDEFWIALYFYEDSPLLGLETDAPTGGHSYRGEPGSWNPTEFGRDYAIRALVQEGGCPMELCVIQLGVEEQNGAVSWWPGYAYPELPPSQCQEWTEYYNDVLGRTIVIHQFNQTRIIY